MFYPATHDSPPVTLMRSARCSNAGSVLLVYVLFSLASLGAVSAETLCDNAFFTNPDWFGAVEGSSSPFDASVLKAISTADNKPAAYPAADSGTCAYFVGNPATCCSEDTLKKIVAGFTAAREIIQTQEQFIKKDPISDTVLLALEGITTVVCDAKLPLYNEALCNKLKATNTTYVKLLADDVQNIVSAQLKCSEGVLAYAEGLVCFACNVEFKNYLDLEKKTIKIATRTCDAIYDQCENAIMVSVQKLLADLQKFVEQIVKDLSGDKLPVPMPSADSIPDMCGGTVAHPASGEKCKEFVCDTMLNGFSSLHWLNWQNKYPAPSKRRALLADKMAPVEAGQTVEEVALAHILDAHSRLSERAQEKFLVEGRGNGGRKLEAYASSHNTYAADGYDAYGVGCANSGVDCGTLPAWAIVLMIVGGTAVILGSVYVTLRRWKVKNANSGLMKGESRNGYQTIA